MVRPRGKASRIHKKLFSLDEKLSPKKKRSKKTRRDESMGMENENLERPFKRVEARNRRRGEKKTNELLSKDYSLNTKPRNP